MLIAADIGGTKSLFGEFEPDSDLLTPARSASLATAEFENPGDLVAAFIGDAQVAGISLAVAGAVVHGRARGSNLPWDVHQAALEERFDCHVHLLNDLEAIAHFVPHAQSDELEVLQEGDRDPFGAIGVIAPGTGIGEAMLFHDGQRLQVARSEAGHIDFAPGDERQDRWLAHLRAEHGHVSLERACSGSSLLPMYDFIRTEIDNADAGLIEAIDTLREAEQDPVPMLMDAALGQRCPAAVATLDMFADILAAAAGNLALQIVAMGGIVIAGGIPPRILPALRRPRFRHVFNAKGRFEHLTRRVPIAVLLNENAGLAGAALIQRIDPLP